MYGGKEYQDAEVNGSLLGLYDFHARYYNPVLGRWFNQDPALQTTNPYLYCGNSPMMYVDKDGKSFWSALTSALTCGLYGLYQHNQAIKLGCNSSQALFYAWGSTAIAAGSAAAGMAVSGLAAGAVSVGGFAGGFVAGAAGEVTGGFISGAFSAGLNNLTFGTNTNMFKAGLKGGLIGGVTGGLMGGVVSGIDAVQSGGKFWNGKVLEIGGSSGAGSKAGFLDEEIPAGAKPTATGEIAKTSTNPNYGKYGMTRSGGTQAHYGVDYAGEIGDDIYAMYDGEVIKIGGSSDYGEHLVRTSSTINGKTYNVDYGHMSNHSVSLKQSVTAGNKVGEMGRLGTLSKPANSIYPTHVHISVWRPVPNLGLTQGFVQPCWK